MASKIRTWFHQKVSPFAAKKYHGLVNQGATDYLNSVLQVLFMTEDFREKVKRNNAGEEHIDKELRDLFIHLEEYEGCTQKITTKLKIKNVYEQRDAAEHYEKILRLTSPEASQIFHGELINTITCEKCNSKTESPAGFWQLPLPLVDNNNEYSVEKGIEDFFRSSEISGDDQMYCETCDEKCDAVLDCVVKNHPEVLVLLLKRFEFDYGYMTYVKIKQPVNVPNTLQISENQSYELYAFVEHSGELRYGHYISTIRSQHDGKWYTFNDSQVAPHKAPPVLERSQSAYLLFYQKQKETPPLNTTNGTGDINETTEEDEQNEETPGSSARKRAGSFDETEQEDKVKKLKQEHSSDQRGQKCQDLDIGSSSSSSQKCDPYVAESNTQSEGKVDHSKVDTEFSDHKQHCIKEESNEHAKTEQESQSVTRQQLVSVKSDQLSQIHSNQERLDKPVHSETPYCEGTIINTNSETLVNTKDGGEERFANELNHGLNKRHEDNSINMPTDPAEVQKEGCSTKPYFEPHEQDQGMKETSEDCCEHFEGCEDRHSCLDSHTKTAISQTHEVMTESKEAYESPHSGTVPLVNAKGDKGGGGENECVMEFNPGSHSGFNHIQATMTEVQKSEEVENQGGCSIKSEDNGGCEGPLSCPDVCSAIEKQDTVLRKNAETIDPSIKNDWRNRFFRQDSSLDQQTTNAKDEIIDKINNGTNKTKSRELSMMNALAGPVEVSLEEENSLSGKEMNPCESSCKNDHENGEKVCNDDGILHRIHDQGLYQKRSSSTESDVPTQKCHPKESLISVEGDEERANDGLEDNVGGAIVQSDNKSTTTAHEETGPGYCTSVNHKDVESSSTVQEVEAEVQREKNDQNFNLEKLKITEKSDFSFNGQEGNNIDAHVKSEETVKVGRRVLTKYDLHLESFQSLEKIQSNRRDREKHKTVQPVPVITTNQAEYYSSGENTEVFIQENALDTSCNVHASEMAGHLERQVTVTGMKIERCVVTIEGDEETIKITPKKRQNKREDVFRHL